MWFLFCVFFYLTSIHASTEVATAHHPWGHLTFGHHVAYCIVNNLYFSLLQYLCGTPYNTTTNKEMNPETRKISLLCIETLLRQVMRFHIRNKIRLVLQVTLRRRIDECQTSQPKWDDNSKDSSRKEEAQRAALRRTSCLTSLSERSPARNEAGAASRENVRGCRQADGMHGVGEVQRLTQFQQGDVIIVAHLVVVWMGDDGL